MNFMEPVRQIWSRITALGSKDASSGSAAPPTPFPHNNEPALLQSGGANTYRGLLNQGATCYLNSVLQVLFMTTEFRKAVKRYNCEHPKTDCIDGQLKTLFDDLEKRTARTNKITKKLGIDRVFEQRDAAEYFEKILNLTSPDASQIFQGELTHKNICSTCDTETNTDGPFWHLPLALVDSSSEDYSVVNGIEKIFSTLNVSGENQMYCDTCGDKADAALKSVMTHHPDVLVLLLKRFEFDYHYMVYVKINRFVNVPCTLKIPENQTYELYAVVDHFGDLRGGHYTATIKSDDDDRWYNFDDTRVSILLYQPFQVDNSERSQSAYLLFYKKKEMDAADTLSEDTSGISRGGLHHLDITTGADDQAQKLKVLSRGTHHEENVEDQNNAGFDDGQNTPEQKISVTAYKDAGVEKQAKEQGKKGDNEHIQKREDSSPRQASLAESRILTEKERVGSDEKTRHMNSQSNASSEFKEDMMGVRDGTKQRTILFGKIVEDFNTDSGMKTISVTKYIIETVKNPEGSIKSHVSVVSNWPNI